MASSGVSQYDEVMDDYTNLPVGTKVLFALNEDAPEVVGEIVDIDKGSTITDYRVKYPSGYLAWICNLHVIMVYDEAR